MNSVVLVGRLSREPELRQTSNGTLVCNFAVACDRRFAKDGASGSEQGSQKSSDFWERGGADQRADFRPEGGRSEKGRATTKNVDFINCVAWKKTAEFVNQYLHKGDRVALSGSIQTRSWENERGEKRYATEVLVNNVEFAQSKKERTLDKFDDYTPDEDFPF